MRPASEVARDGTVEAALIDVEWALGIYIRACDREGGLRDEPEQLRGARNKLFRVLESVIEGERQEVRAAALEEVKADMFALKEVAGSWEVNGFALALIVRMEARRALATRAPR